MTDMHRTLVAAGLALAGSAASFAAAPASEILAPAKQRFGGEKSTETPDFQKHVLPMMGRVGCNGRSCHGSFQGQGGFRLSLFGYDFTADHDALLKGEKPRIEPGEPEESKAVKKATGRMPHKGGKVIAPDSWEHQLLARWIEAGAKPAAHKASFAKLEVTPAEIVFTKPGEKIPLRVVAVWSDGVREDVTCLARFRTNDESIVKVDAEGVVSAAGKGDTHVVAFYDNGVHAVPAMLAVSDKIGANYPAIATPTKIDALVVEKLKKVGIVPSEICTDGEFLRRVSLDLTGTLPSPAEIDGFSKSKDPEKRSLKIEELLKRPAYAAWWTTKLCDVTGQNLGQLQEQQLQQVRYAMYRGWYDWIRKRVEENVPYDKIVEGIVLATSREKGQSYEQYAKQMSDAGRADKPGCLADRETMPFFWGRRNVAKSEEKALNFAYAFLGVRLQCAECHKHPFDQWTQQDFKQFTAFFNSIQYGLSPEARKFDQAFQEKLGLKQLKDGQDRQKKTSEAYAKGETVPVREVFVNAAVNARMNPKGKAARNQKNAPRVITPKVLGGEEVLASQYSDPREPLMEWMRDSSNPYFAKSIVNRVWATYFSVGIIEPPDDMNLANPPSNEALLDYLADAFIEHKFDLKWLHREICNSQAYQRSIKPNETNRLDERNFARASIRRLPAEVAYDALVVATAHDAERTRLASATDERSIGVAPRQGGGGGGRRNNDAFALRIFGKPERATSCDCERSNDPTLVQSLYLRNDFEVTNLLNRREGWLAALATASGQRLDGAEAPRPDQRRNAKGKDGKPPEPSLEDQIKTFENRLTKLKASPKKNPNLVKEMETRLADLKKKQAALAARETGVKANQDVEALIRESYLRTVSRPPTREEIEIAKQHIAESRNLLVGLRDVLWALLNTKEFITNH